MPNDSNENNRTVTVGTILIAIDECILDVDERPTLTLDKEYPVIDLYSEGIIVEDDEGTEHHFTFDYLNTFFKIKSIPGDDFTITTNQCEDVIPIYENPTDKKITADCLKEITEIAELEGLCPDGIWNEKALNILDGFLSLRIAELREEAGKGLPTDEEIEKIRKKISCSPPYDAPTFKQGWRECESKLAPTIAALKKEKQELNQELFLKNRECELLIKQLTAEKEESRKKLIGFLFELRLDGDDNSKSIAEVVDNYLKDSSLADKQSEGKLCQCSENKKTAMYFIQNWCDDCKLPIKN